MCGAKRIFLSVYCGSVLSCTLNSQNCCFEYNLRTLSFGVRQEVSNIAIAWPKRLCRSMPTEGSDEKIHGAVYGFQG